MSTPALYPELEALIYGYADDQRGVVVYRLAP